MEQPGGLVRGVSTGAKPAGPTELERIFVDLTPMLPGGENGGVKVMVLELVRQLGIEAPDCEIILLTNETTHDELAFLDAPNVQRQRAGAYSPVAPTMPPAAPASVQPGCHALVRYTVQRLKQATPAALRRVMRPIYRVFRSLAVRSLNRFGSPIVRALSPWLLLLPPPHPVKPLVLPAGVLAARNEVVFCPFTVPSFVKPLLPQVVLICDIQFAFYPQFFDAAELASRTRNFQLVSKLARWLICISEYVRGTVLDYTDRAPEDVVTLHIRTPHRLPEVSPYRVTSLLWSYGLRPERYLLYPANFWPHKNHEMLLTAFGMYRARHPNADLKLVLTGTFGPRVTTIQHAVKRMGLEEYVVLAGYLPTPDLSALMRHCLALIFPSLYEGFGMPALEAMALDRPVVCSNVTSLPEVVGDAALLFDPRRPTEIVSAIETVEANEPLRQTLVQRGRERLAVFDDSAAMAREYLEVLRAAVSTPPRHLNMVYGLYPDHWTRDAILVTVAAGMDASHVELELAAPDWLPHPGLTIAVLIDQHEARHWLATGKTLTIRQVVPVNGIAIHVLLDPLVQPSAQGSSSDTRWLGARCTTCRLVREEELIEDLLETVVYRQ